MARKTARLTKSRAPEKYMLLYSDCGSDEQMERYGASTYTSIEAAKKDISSCDVESTKRFYVVKVVSVGNQKTIAWS